MIKYIIHFIKQTIKLLYTKRIVNLILMSYITVILSLFIFVLLFKNIKCNTEKTTEVECNTTKIIIEVGMQFEIFIIEPFVLGDANMNTLCDHILTPCEVGDFGRTSNYSDINDCFDHFTGTYTINNDMVSNSNSSTCRVFYAMIVNLVIRKMRGFSLDVLKDMSKLTIKNIDPSIYCPHIGETGGNKCVDTKKSINVDLHFVKYKYSFK